MLAMSYSLFLSIKISAATSVMDLNDFFALQNVTNLHPDLREREQRQTLGL